MSFRWKIYNLHLVAYITKLWILPDEGQLFENSAIIIIIIIIIEMMIYDINHIYPVEASEFFSGLSLQLL